ncbi:MAG: hypothetical protein H7Y27_14425 [Gemmatimonadaceae bacterium]|nr:hypothetical protein [Chitinophagaceae bacterium]
MNNSKKRTLFSVLCTACLASAVAQTDIDGIMMTKNNFCVGPVYSYSSWKNYWEGTLKRDNENLGTVSTQQFAVMGNYGISDKLNVLFNVPYVKTKATDGTLHGLKGFQDLSLFVKYMPVEKKIGKSDISLYAIGGVSTPLTNYTPDFLPMSIGLASTNVMLRAMADYQRGKFFTTISGTYIWRSNVKIDRDSYYDTELHLSNEVEMPNVATFNFRAGYRSQSLIAEAVVNNMTTLGGFDITKNNMPFPSNKMNATMVGVNFKYVVIAFPELSVIAGANTTVAGRNVGQSTGFYGGLFYVFDLGRKSKSTPQTSQSK